MHMRKKLGLRATTLSCLLAALVLALASPARGEDDSTEQARQHYETGTKQYDLGHWDDAIREFEKAYELRPDPSFLYNLAQAYRRKGDSKRALDLYRNYLAKTPKSPLRPEIEERIKSLQKQIDEEASAKPVPPALQPTVPPTAPPAALPLGQAVAPAPAEAQVPSSPQAGSGPAPGALPATAPVFPPTNQPGQAAPLATGSEPVASVATASPPAAPGRTLRIAGIVCGSVGVAFVGMGVGFGLLAHNLSSKVASAKTFNRSDDSAGLLYEKLQWGFYFAGASVAAVGATLYYFGMRAARTASGVTMAPVLGPGTAGVSAMGVF
jgi:hypothetical protein